VSEPLVMYPELNTPQAQFLASQKKYSLFLGGYGCVREDTPILTARGFRPISEVGFGDDVVSWNEKDQKFQLSPTSGGFPKGKANLYRVTTTQGEFVSSGHHRICVGKNTYKRVDMLDVGQMVFAFSEIQRQTTGGLARVWSPEGDLYYWKTIVDYLVNCEDESRLYGQPLLRAVSNGLSKTPLQGDAHICAQHFSQAKIWHLDARLEQTHRHIHQGLYAYLQHNLDCMPRVAHHGEVWGDQTQQKFFERIWQKRLELFVLFLLQNGFHQQASLFVRSFPVHPSNDRCSRVTEMQNLSALCDMVSHTCAELRLSLPDIYRYNGSTLQSFLSHLKKILASLQAQGFCPKPYQPHNFDECSSTSNARIISIEKESCNDWFWDIHVAGNNNYIDKSGLLHHNSGKTWVGCAGLAQHFWRHPGINAGYFAPTYPQIRDIFYPTVEECFAQWGLIAKVRAGNNEVHAYSGRQLRGIIMCRSMDRPETIIGFKIGHALVDEIDVLPADKAYTAWRKIIARMRYNIPGLRNGVDVTTTPEGFKFAYNQFEKKPREKPELAKLYGIVRASTYDNEINLPDDYIPSLLESYPAQLIDAYINGQFVNLTSGTVYVAFDKVKNTCSYELKDGEVAHVGMDFNVGKMAAVIHVVRDGQPCAVDEIVGAYDTPDMIRRLQERLWGYSGGQYSKTRQIRVYPDASGDSRRSVNASKTDLALIKEAGFQVCAPNANPPVKDRINGMNAMFCNADGERKYFVNGDKCPSYVEALEQQAYAPNGEPDKTTGYDHVVDAAGYFIAYKYPIIKKTVTAAHYSGMRL
jgi:hypothetical protein